MIAYARKTLMPQVFLAVLIILPLTWSAPQLGGYGYTEPQWDALNTAQQQLANGPVGIAQQHRGGERYLPPASTTTATIVRKQFYLISAPETEDNQVRNKHLVLGRPQRNYRVLFIKAPSSDNANVQYSAEFAPQEEKTVIYVLSKKDSALNVNDIATPAPTQPSKPEVFFIKYKTNEEAVAAQREIQSQYDQLGGTNEFSNEGVAPITSVVGSLEGQTPEGAYEYRPVFDGADGNSALSQYLPPV